MPGLRLVFAVLAGGAALVTVVTAIWVARRRTHAWSVSLALNVVFGVLVIVALADGCVPVWSEELSVTRADKLGLELSEELDRAIWKLVPRGRVTLRVSSRVLAAPLEGIDQLAVSALQVGVQVDVRSDDADKLDPMQAPGRGEPRVEFVWRDEGNESAIATGYSFPLVGSPDVIARLAGTRPGESECHFDGRPRTSDEPRGQDSSLEQLARRVATLEPGWHHIECEFKERSAVRYVEMTGEGVIVASRVERDMVWADESEDPADHGIQAASVSMDPRRMRGADMLIVDEEVGKEACEAAKAVLARGGSVIMAMPTSADCPDLVPSNLVQKLVDRRPRFTFVNDPSFDELKHVPSCAGLTGCRLTSELKALPSGVQDAWIEDACGAALGQVAGQSSESCLAAYTDGLSGHVGTFLEREPPGLLSNEILLNAMEVGEAIDALMQARSGMSAVERQTVRDNHVVWILSTDPRRVADPTEFRDFLEATGARVEVIGVKDPYALTLAKLYPDRALKVRRPSGGVLISDPTARFDQPLGSCIPGEGRCVDELDPQLLASLDPGSDGQARVEQLGSGRFFPPLSQAVIGFDGARSELIRAPIRFHLWDPRAEPSSNPGGAFLPFGALLATQGPSGFAPRILALGTMVGRGHLLLLSYSPFEFQAETEGVPLADGTDLRWLGAEGAGRIPALAHDPIRRLHRTTRAFASEAGVGVHQVETRAPGTLDIEVYRPVETRAPDLMSLDFEGAKSTGRLVDFDFARGSFRYRVDLGELFPPGPRPCSTIRPALPHASAIAVCPALAGQTRLILPGEAALGALAGYTGGCYGAHDCSSQPAGRSKPVWVLLASLCFAGIWGRRLYRWSQARSEARRAIGRESEVQRRYDAPAAVVASAGEWGAQATTWTRTGASGGLRPLEPGDRVSAMVVDDLIRMSRGDRSVLPRMSLRIEEAAARTSVIVNLGASMRVPSAKVALAAQVAELLASHVWQGRTSASVRAAGIVGDSTAVAETTLHPGRGEVERNLLELLRQPIRRTSTPWAVDMAEVGALVYISDFLSEDLDALSLWLTQTEASGVRVAGILVYSVVEFTMIETGRLTSSHSFVDRADWSTRDVAQLMRLRADQVERIFDSSSGGLTIADTSMTTQDLQMVLEERRVLEVLR